MKFSKLMTAFLLLISCCILVGCGSSIDEDSKKDENVTVQLNLNNYHDYIAITKTCSMNDYSSTTYWNFSGSSNITYNNVVVSYTETYSTETKKCELTIFGSGQIVGSWYSGSRSGESTIVDVSGSIQYVKKRNQNNVQLNMENYTQYISTSNQSYSNDSTFLIYWNFNGSSNITYNNVIISYTISSDKIENCTLTIFGCGQILGYYHRTWISQEATIVNVSGTVEF